MGSSITWLYMVGIASEWLIYYGFKVKVYCYWCITYVLKVNFKKNPHIHIYIYICMYVCMCVCVCISTPKPSDTQRDAVQSGVSRPPELPSACSQVKPPAAAHSSWSFGLSVGLLTLCRQTNAPRYIATAAALPILCFLQKFGACLSHVVLAIEAAEQSGVSTLGFHLSHNHAGMHDGCGCVCQLSTQVFTCRAPAHSTFCFGFFSIPAKMQLQLGSTILRSDLQINCHFTVCKRCSLILLSFSACHFCKQILHFIDAAF